VAAYTSIVTAAMPSCNLPGAGREMSCVGCRRRAARAYGVLPACAACAGAELRPACPPYPSNQRRLTGGGAGGLLCYNARVKPCPLRGEPAVARIVSFVVLVAILLVIAALFFQVMKQFLLPMFLAVLLAIMFGPLYRWSVARCRGHDRLAAGLATVLIVLILLIPVLAILIPAFFEGQAIYTAVLKSVGQESREAPAVRPGEDAGPIQQAGEAEKPERQKSGGDALAFKQWAATELVRLGDRAGLELTVEDVEQTITAKVQQWMTPVALSTTQYVVGFLIGLGVMVISLYYFLADGPGMIRTIMRLSPLDDKYERQLFEQFDNTARAVVVAMLLSAFAQGLLAGVGFYFAGLHSVFLLMVLAMLLALVPFVGAAVVWVPACLWLYFYQGRTLAAILLAIYCAAVVSLADNVLKPIVLHGRSSLHPLLALLSVLGGVQALGPIGIFVGPMVVAFLQTLLNMLHTELDSMSGGWAAKSAG
jgi:predicted PurR-regulated permease PerM